MRRFFLHLTALFLVTQISTAPKAQELDEWIVLGSDAAQTLENTLSIMDSGAGTLQSRFEVVADVDGRTIARLDPSLEGLLHRTMHAVHHRCGGYTVHPNRQSALSEVDNPNYAPGVDLGANLFPQAIDQQVHVMPALGLVQPKKIISTIRHLQSLGTRYYQSEPAQTAALDVRHQWESYGSNRNDFSTRLVKHSWLQNSVIATIRGAELPDEIVVIGAHLDSINSRGASAAPGADDDASGVAVVSEVLRVLLASGFRPKRTLEFMAYSAEEVGLRGSGEIAAAYGKAGKTVVAAMQVDMTGLRGSDHDLYFITDYVSNALNLHIKALIAEYHASGVHRITWGETKCGYGCSDHVSWTRNGYASFFPFEAEFSDYNRNIHTENDLLSEIDETGANQARFAKLGLSFMIEVGKSAVPHSPQRGSQYIYTTRRVISSEASRGCRASDWPCMTNLCRQDLGPSAWRGWAGCQNEAGSYSCIFECSTLRRKF